MSGTGTHTAINRIELPRATAGRENRFATGSRWVHRGAGPDRIGAVSRSLTGIPIQANTGPTVTRWSTGWVNDTMRARSPWSRT